MFDQILSFLAALGEQTGVAQFYWGNVVMMAIGIAMILLAVIKKYEPLLLVGIGFACVISNVPGSTLLQPGGLFYDAYLGVSMLILPPLIFFGVGAMTDFAPMLANPKLVILGAAAHLGIFVALIGAKLLGFTIYEACAIGIIGGADGPMAIFMAVKLAPKLLPQISVAAYSYMALMPLIQPPVMRLLTTKRERKIRMKQMRSVSRLEKIAFPIVIGVIVNLLLPPVAPLITMLMMGNLFKEVLVTDRLAQAAANTIMNVVLVLLDVAIGSTMVADKFLTFATIEVLALGLFAFLIGTGSGVIGAKLMNLVLTEKINPLLGSAGIASVPIAARVTATVALEDDPENFLIYQAMGPNLAGVFGTALSGGIMLALLR
jgi:sodium ion-translocating decarboxylase beta subunit